MTFGTENKEKDPKFKIGDHVRILKYKSIFAKGSTLNWSEKVFVIKKVKLKLCHRHMLLVILIVKKLLKHFTKKNCKKRIKKSLKLKNLLKQKVIC